MLFHGTAFLQSGGVARDCTSQRWPNPKALKLKACQAPPSTYGTRQTGLNTAKNAENAIREPPCAFIESCFIDIPACVGYPMAFSNGSFCLKDNTGAKRSPHRSTS
jgi:hypothetical protein